MPTRMEHLAMDVAKSADALCLAIEDNESPLSGEQFKAIDDAWSSMKTLIETLEVDPFFNKGVT
jgi:hypothetical protein